MQSFQPTNHIPFLWIVFDNEAEKETMGQQFIQLVQEQLTKANGEQV